MKSTNHAKRSLSFLLAVIMLLTLAACGGKGGANNKSGNVDSIQIETKNAAIRYVGYEYVSQEYFSLGIGNRNKTVFIKFEYTNKTNEPLNVKSDFSFSVSQNGKELQTMKTFNSEADTTAIMNYFNGTAINETLPIYYSVIMEDYSPLTVTVSTVSGNQTVVQNMVVTVEAPEGVIVPNDSPVEPTELVGDWINPSNGDKLVIKEGDVNPNTNIIRGGADYTPADNTLGSYTSITGYVLEGDIITLREERFRVTKEANKLYFKGLDSDTTYMFRSDYYRFEDVQIHQIGETISTDAMEFTLNGYQYADEVNPVALGGNVSAFIKEPLVPDSEMIWANVSYQLFNKSNNTISLRTGDTNVRFAVVYQNNYTFEMAKKNADYITKGYGGDERVEWLGSSSNEMTFTPLAKEDFDTWFPIAPVVRDDTSTSLYLLVLLPKTSGTELFVYEVKNS